MEYEYTINDFEGVVPVDLRVVSLLFASTVHRSLNAIIRLNYFAYHPIETGLAMCRAYAERG